jgi:hypothetical protein
LVVSSTAWAFKHQNRSIKGYKPVERVVSDIMFSVYRVFHFEVSISAPSLDLGSKSQQILTLAWGRSIWDFHPLGAKTRAMPGDFSDTLDVKPVS